MSQPVLVLDKLSLAIKGARVVDGLSLEVGAREVVALVGESGCGKSISALSILGLLPNAVTRESGRILLGGRDLAQASAAELRATRGRDASIIFQEPTASLDPLSTVGAQVMEALQAHEKVSGRQPRQRARDMLAAVGIPDPERRLDQYAFELSGGMCQRIMIAIALICGPKLLIADEPTTALDVTIQAQILDLMKELVATRGASILLITHDMGVVADMADRVVVMYAGRAAEIAPVHDLFAQPRHPYTALLLASSPHHGLSPKQRLATIEGTVPQPSEFGAGCRFASRCPLALDKCRAQQPPLVESKNGHFSACWRADEAARLKAEAA